MRILRASVKGEMDKMYDEKKLKEINEEQGRIRINSHQVEALIAMSVGRQLIEDAYAELGDLAEYAGAAQRVKQVIPMSRNAVQLMTSKVDAEQMITILNNTRQVQIVLSADPVDGKINISYRNMAIVVSAALDTCQLSCTCNREESKRCVLRRAYDNVPGMKLAAKNNSKDPERCPYVGLEIEAVEE